MKYRSHLNKKKSIRPPFGGKIARNLMYMTDKRNTLLEPSLKVLFITFGWGATLKN